MSLSDKALYTAFLARDSRFDGRFFVGIKSTGIYCRPVCPARRAKAENCAFYPSPAAAELAGYRPCLLCRPEKAPGPPQLDSPALRAARLLEDPEGEQGLDAVAALGYPLLVGASRKNFLGRLLADALVRDLLTD